MTQTVGAHILERLHGHGIRRVYGYPGAGINGILGGFHEHGGPVLVEAVVDPEVPPLPPHIEFEQAKNLARALVQGDPARGRIVRQSLKAKALLNR